MARRNGGFVGQDGLDAPDIPTGVTASAGISSVSVAFTAPTDTGTSAITGFVAQVSTDDTAYSAGSNTGTSSPIAVSSLTNGTAVTVKVWAINAYGTSAPSAASSSVTPSTSGAAVIGGGISGYAASLEAILMASLGNSLDFGDLAVGVSNSPAGVGNTARIIFAGGFDGSNNSDVIQFGTYAGGTFEDFGNLTNGRNGTCGCNNNTRAVFSGSSTSPGNVIDYITIASEGNTTDFGDSTQARESVKAVNSTTRGVFIGAESHNVIDYITFGSTGNATDFGDMVSAATHSGGACSNATRGLYAGGNRSGNINDIQYITIANTGNASDFGDLTTATVYLDGGSSATRAVFMGSASGNIIQYVTIASTGNATDFGDLIANRVQIPAATSNAHGGLS